MTVPQLYQRMDILEASRDLEDFFNRDRIRINFDPTRIWVPSEAANRLENWIISKTSSIISIAGPESRHLLGPNATTMLAGSIGQFLHVNLP